MSARVYHVQLRQFPHNACRFNLADAQVRAVLEPWAHGQPLELEGRRWMPGEATLTVIEGPRLELADLSMGRGWRAAERAGEDVTERLLAAARTRVATPMGVGASRPPAAPSGQQGDPLALAVQLASLLGADAESLLAAWRAVAAERPGLAPSETLLLAERRVRDAGIEGS